MKHWAVPLLLLLGLSLPLFAGTTDLQDVEQILQIAPSRNMGSACREALDEYVAKRFRDTGLVSGKITFPTAAFIPGETQLAVAGGLTLPLHSLMPNSVHPGNFPKGGWSGRLVDLRKGTAADLAVASPMNAAVLLDMNSRRAWVTALELGAQALIFVGGAESERDAAGIVYPVPISVPRFYLSESDAQALRAMLGEGRSADVAFIQKRPNRWENVEAINDWVIVPGVGLNADKVVHLQAFKDASSIVPELSPGAESACCLALMLRLLDYYTANPPDCTIVFSAVSDHCNYMRGEQFFMAAAYPYPPIAAEEITARELNRREAEFYASVYAAENRTPEKIALLRFAKADASGRTLFLKAPLLRRFEYERNRLRHNIALIDDQLRRTDIKAEEIAQFKEERVRLETTRDDYIAIASILQRWGGSTSFDTMGDASSLARRQQLFRNTMASLETRYANQLADARREIQTIESNNRLAELLKGKELYLYLSLDLSFGNERMGFFHCGGDGLASPGTENVDQVARISVELARQMQDGSRFFADTIRNAGGIAWRNHLADKFPLASSVGYLLVIPSLTLTTTADPRDVQFTPRDTLDHLPRARVAGMMEFARNLLTNLLADKAFATAIRPARVKNYGVLSFRYKLRRIDPYSVEIPNEPVVGAAVIGVPKISLSASGSDATEMIPRSVAGQVTLYQIALTDRQGEALFRAVPWLCNVEAYGFKQDFSSINSVIDAGAGARRMDPTVQTGGYNWLWADQICLMFDCIQTDIVGVCNPDTRIRTDSIIMLDAIREASPDHYGITGIPETRSARFHPIPGDEGIACVFTDGYVPFKILSNDFILINATDNQPTGAGFYPGDPRLRMVSSTAANDLQTLNSMRLRRIEKKGVTNPAAALLFKQAGELVGEADAARAQGDQNLFLSKSVEALSNSLRSYRMVRDTTSDLIKAVAVFLALVIPFCMFAMKLVIPWTDVRAQIASFLIIFVLMATALALLHPAFSLSQTPMMVLLAFMMVGLAAFVMFILYSRFDAGLQQLVEESQGVESSESSRKALAGVAFSVGVNNMRRRRIRTSLTAATIVLVTFTMLSVISVGTSLTPYRRQTETNVPYNGVLFAKPGMEPIRESAQRQISQLLRPYGQVVARSWTQRLDSYGDYMRLEIIDAHNPRNFIAAKSLLGLDVAEDGFISPMPLAAGRWFSGNDARELVLSTEAAGVLGITAQGFTPRDLYLRNELVRLVGLLDDEKVAVITDLAKLPLLPLESQPDPVSRAVSETGQMTVSADDATASPVPAARALRPINCGFIPLGFALTLPDTTVRTIALKADGAADESASLRAWNAANHFVAATGTLTYTGISEKITPQEGASISAAQYSLGPPRGASVGGVSKVLIPICLAATIILNTMLGAVMERKKEMSVYNSIGLNPTHVFVFFVAEAIVFGLVGAVSGYLIGQGLALLISHYNWLPGMPLNYSSMAVIGVIFASIVTVIVSTLYPAYIATRVSVPSGQRRWKLPQPDGDELNLDFPFSFNEEQLPRVCAFLHAFMDLNSEASSGQFLAQDARFGFVRDRDGRKVLTMLYSVTPVPFDLGVNQRMEIYGHYQPRVRAYVLRICLTRVKGDKTAWMVVNQPFMESLRARLLSWRSQSLANQEQFRIQGDALFAAATEFPIKKKAAR
jgi:hypothetical protein